jgi:nanoRNase/pAp phosphatase (c-di-AMP/oligoRNAs hydrolase)
VSEAGNALVNMGYDIGLAWFENGRGQISFSLRSNKKGSDVDVSAIAKTFGGGGHRNAAGFQIGVKEGRELVDTILGRKDYGVSTPRCC